MATVNKARQILLDAAKSKYLLAQNISEKLWNNPELSYQEYESVKLLASCFKEHKFHVQRFSGRLSTAFVASYGAGRPNIAVICEYDALPSIGHGCGHNLIAEAGIIAGLAIKDVLEAYSGAIQGTVTVFGTPAEEGGCGKAVMIQEGLFEGIDVAIMAHPSPYNDAFLYTYLAVQHVLVTYHGEEGNVSCVQWEGKNALDAAVLAYNSVSLLRQQIKPECRVHGIITEGGTTPEIVPGRTQLCYYIRAPHKKQVGEIRQKMDACFKSSAAATGCSVDITEPCPMYESLLTNDRLASVFVEEANTQGLEFPTRTTGALCGSTDMGNVSQIVPSIHPKYRICTAKNHTAEFTVASNTPQAHAITQKIGVAMGLTALRIFQDERLLEEILSEFKQQSTH
jgi:amidohydrolase